MGSRLESISLAELCAPHSSCRCSSTIGTIVVACLSGRWVAALTGLLTNLFLALVANPVYLPYAAVSVLFGRRLYGQGPDCSTRSGAFVGHLAVCTFVNAISASLITTFVYGGATGINGTSVLTATLVVAMKDILASVISSSLIENLLDKGITVAIAWVIVQKKYRRFLSQYAADSTGARTMMR